jgi:hypothetical protein
MTFLFKLPFKFILNIMVKKRLPRYRIRYEYKKKFTTHEGTKYANGEHELKIVKEELIKSKATITQITKIS